MASWIPKIVYNAITVSFTYPPEKDPVKENIRSNVKTTASITGLEQSAWFYNEEIFTINFRFLTSTELNNLRTFYEDWGSRGKAFDYYIHDDEVTFNTYTLKAKSFNPKRQFADGAGDFIYDVSIQMRRVL